MYHTGVDPKEKYNLAKDEKYADIKVRLKNRFEELVKKYK
jgi:hypothetical protein